MPTVQPDNAGVLLFAHNLLKNYTGNNSWWRRFFTGKWRRSHLYDAGVLLGELSKNNISNPIDLLGRLHLLTTKANYNPRGALADCIRRIWMAVMDNPAFFTQSANNTDAGYVRANSAQISLLSLAMEQQRSDADLDKIFATIATADVATQIHVFRNTLVQMMGVNYPMKEWALDIPVLTNRINDRVNYDYLPHLPRLMDAIRLFSFEQKKLILLPALISAIQLGRDAAVDRILDSLFEDQSPTDTQKRWLIETVIDSQTGFYAVLESAIHDGGIHILTPPAQTKNTFFAGCDCQNTDALKKLGALTETAAVDWTIIASGKRWLTAGLSVDRNDPGLIQSVTESLGRLVDFGILRLDQFVEGSRMLFRCSHIDTVQLGMHKTPEVAAVKPTHSHHGFD